MDPQKIARGRGEGKELKLINFFPVHTHTHRYTDRENKNLFSIAVHCAPALAIIFFLVKKD